MVKITKKVIAPTSNRFAEIRAQHRENPSYRRDRGPQIFGYAALKEISQIKKDIESGLIAKPEGQRSITSILHKCRIDLEVEYHGINAQRAAVERFFDEGKQLVGYVGQDGINDLWIRNLTMSDETFEAMLQGHVDRGLEKVRETEERFKLFKAEFIQGVLADIDAGILPIDRSYAQSMLQEAHVRFVDDLLIELHSAMFAGWVKSSRSSDTTAVYIPETLGQEDFEGTAVHELFHLLSGRTLISAFAEGSQGEHLLWIDYARYGLLKNAIEYSNGDHLVETYRWLNEGTTELLTVQYLQRRGRVRQSGVYSEEREAIRLKSLDISSRSLGTTEEQFLQLLIAAYFEHYNPNVRREERLPAWKHIQQIIRQLPEWQRKTFLNNI